MCFKKVEKEFLREIRIGFSGPNKPPITRRSSCCIAKGRILVDRDGEGGHWRSDAPQDRTERGATRKINYAVPFPHFSGHNRFEIPPLEFL